jgi:hypothetical protein
VKTDVFTCPFCCFEVPQQAVVCGHCARDLVGLKPLILELNRLSEEVALQRSEILDLKESVSAVKASLAMNEVCLPQTIGEHAATPSNGNAGVVKYFFFLGAIFLCLATLIFSHWLLLFVYDVSPIVLRLVTVSLPLIFGFFTLSFARVHWVINFVGSTFLGVFSVLCMLYVTSAIDGVSFLPETARDWREASEYALSICAGFFTGYWIENWRHFQQSSSRRKINLSLLLEKDSKGQFKITGISEQVQTIAALIAPVVSAGTAVYSGLKIFIG